MAIWQPSLEGRQGPKYLRIVEALAEDVAAGRLEPGMRLPPHRELAYLLGISPNTTSRAYAEAVSRGLLRGEVGRGTYVRDSGPPPVHADAADMLRPRAGPIDLSRNLPFPGIADTYLARTLAELAQSSRLQALLSYQVESDLHHHADAAIAWLRRVGLDGHRDEVVITNGAQHGLLASLMAIMQSGDVLLAEELTYAPVKALAERLALKLAAAPIDDGGLCPEAFDRICRTHAVKALYFTPTLHTPTTVTMDERRRKAVVEIARRHDVVLIEDDVFGPLMPDRPSPVAGLAPERTIYITSTSKCLAPGLRVGFVRAPKALAAGIRGAVNLSCWMPPPFMAEVASRWIADGTADRLTEIQRREAERRQGIAREIFAGHAVRADRHGFHLWLELPPAWTAEDFRAEAARRDVKITAGGVFAARPDARCRAVRLCLSHEPDAARVRSGLQTLRRILEDTTTRSELVL